jgi:tryptophan synthase alpha chain
MNKINQVFTERGDRKLLSLYFCAGTPSLEGTGEVIKTMQRRGIDFIEVGIPFSDPLADGPVIQTAATKALKNGMSVRLLFEQLKAIKDEVSIPLILMGYLNPILHYGIEAFCRSCADAGVSGMIIPDLPFDDYLNVVKPAADKYDLRVIMLITPETSEDRLRHQQRPDTESCSGQCRRCHHRLEVRNAARRVKWRCQRSPRPSVRCSETLKRLRDKIA